MLCGGIIMNWLFHYVASFLFQVFVLQVVKTRKPWEKVKFYTVCWIRALNLEPNIAEVGHIFCTSTKSLTCHWDSILMALGKSRYSCKQSLYGFTELQTAAEEMQIGGVLVHWLPICIDCDSYTRTREGFFNWIRRNFDFSGKQNAFTLLGCTV